MTGQLGILNVGAGDTKLTFDVNNPEERKRACAIVSDMLTRGYALLIEVGKDADGKPITQRCDAFDPKTGEYIITDHVATKRGGRRSTRRIEASTTTGVAVARVAGG